jgi:hypothetical protein
MVDSIEYLRMKEQLAETKARMKDVSLKFLLTILLDIRRTIH